MPREVTAPCTIDDQGLAFLAGGGEMGARMRAYDWTAASLGDPGGWPQSLKAVVQIILNSRFAMWMAWGPELLFFCNDAYLPTVGLKRDWVLGARSDKVWSEIWPDIGPRIEHVLTSGEATWDEALRLYLERQGFAEETFHTFSYSPLADDNGQTSGMLCVVAEVTERVIGERQLSTLRDLGSYLSAASTRSEVMRAFEACLEEHPNDIPYALVYLSDPDRKVARRAAAHNVDGEAPRAPAQITLASDDTDWPLHIRTSQEAVLVDVQSENVGFRLQDHWQLPPARAITLPIASTDADVPVGHLIAGLNPHRAFDREYSGFLDLLIGQLAAAIARADEFERERARAEALAEIDRAKTVFFSNVSHEFRTPLTLMLGPLDELLAKPPEILAPEHRSLVDVAHRNGSRLLRLVNALLDFSRIEAGRTQAHFESTDLAALTAEISSTFRSATELAGLTLSIDCDALERPACVDRSMWETIILNLLSNAFKFTFEGGIAVGLSQSGDNAALTIRDTGTGIPEHELPKLFERFHRVEGARGRSFEGSGIGLALVRELVMLHGGYISVESELGRGTAFTVTMPLDIERHANDSDFLSGPIATRAKAFVDEAIQWLPDAGSEPATQGERSTNLERTASGREKDRRILVADDNADMRQYVARLLGERGYSVEAFADGQAALDAIRHARPDLVVTDVMMPKLDGFGMLRAIRSDERLHDLPVIMLSARAGEEVRIDGLDAGADDYLTKPFSARELGARVDATLAMAKLRRETSDALRSLNQTLEQRVEERTLERDRLWALSRDPFLVADMTGRWLRASPAWTELLGWSHEELIGRTSEWLEHPEDWASTRAEHARIVGGSATLSFENRFRAKDGSYRWFAWTAVAEGELIYAVARDVTVSKRAAAELEAAQQALRQSQKMEAMGQLTGGVAHDFNNLLTPIVGALDIVQRQGLGTERQQRLIAGAIQSADRAKVLVQRLLAFARRQPLQSTAVDIGRLVHNMFALIESTTGPTIQLEIDIESEVPAARADANQLEMALLNLCVNARDAMPQGGALRVAVSTEPVSGDHRAKVSPGNYVRLAVSDTGVGMDESTLVRAIEPFFSTKGIGKGTGLGLSMVHGLASQLDGALTIQSSVNVGTTIELWLPVNDSDREIKDYPETGAISFSAAGLALLVDDEELVRLSTCDMLRELGYEVIEAACAEEALKLVRGGLEPDLIVTDHLMPGMSGTDLAHTVLAERPELKFLIVSGYADASGVASELPLLTKPFRLDELATRVVELSKR